MKKSYLLFADVLIGSATTYPLIKPVSLARYPFSLLLFLLFFAARATGGEGLKKMTDMNLFLLYIFPLRLFISSLDFPLNQTAATQYKSSVYNIWEKLAGTQVHHNDSFLMHTAKTWYRKFETNIHRNETASLVPNFHIHIYVSVLYVPTSCPPIFC